MFLIIAGGIGFFTWDDIYTHKFHIKRYRMQSKIILTTTALLIILPAVLFFLCNFKELPFGKRLILSLFQSVTPRTAGFNTADISSMTDSSQAVMILLMFIGGSPKLYCRRYKDNHLCGSVIKCFCNFPQPRRCLCLWTPLWLSGYKKCSNHYDDVLYTFFHRRHCNQYLRRTSSFKLFIWSCICGLYRWTNIGHYSKAAHSVPFYIDSSYVSRACRRTNINLCNSV